MITTTLKKISQVSGLSISTISRALKNHPDISEKTKKLVTELANTLDYEPNANAIHLRTSNSKLFGLIVPSISNFFYDSFIASVEENCRKAGYSLMILQSGDDAEIESTNIKICKQNRITGLFACIASEHKNIDTYLKLEEVNIPVIFFDKVPEKTQCHKVCVADVGSATIAANVIVKRNKKKVTAIFGNSDFLITKKRFETFTRILHEHNIQCSTAYALSSEDAERITEQFLKENPDTIFCMTDEILIGVMRAIQKNKLRIPEDISVIAISNGFIPTLYHPQITYVETSGVKLGKLAFESMMTTLAGSTFINDRTVESVLVNGGSI